MLLQRKVKNNKKKDGLVEGLYLISSYIYKHLLPTLAKQMFWRDI